MNTMVPPSGKDLPSQAAAESRHPKRAKKARAEAGPPLDLREDDGVALFPYDTKMGSPEVTTPKENSPAKEPREYSAPAVDRTLDILEFMALNHRPFGVTELSRELGVPVNSIFRILKRLTEREYTIQDPVSGGYQLSTRVFSLGMSLYARYELRHCARAHLEWLCRETQETCQLSIPRGDKMLLLDATFPDSDYYFTVVPGSLGHYHGSAFGKSILAFMDEEEVKEILPVRLVSLTTNTIQYRAELLKSFELTRSTGLAYDNQEYITGIFCIGSPVFDVLGKVVAGLGISGLISTFGPGQKEIFEQLVLDCAAKVSASIGYSGTYFDNKVRPPEANMPRHSES